MPEILPHRLPAAGRFSPLNLFGLALVVLGVAVASWPALHGDWIWDDTLDLTGNRLLRDPAGLAKIWLQPAAGLYDYYPVKFSVQWLQWQLWQANPVGYHVTNVVLHLVSCLLLWRVLQRLGVRHGWIGAALFAVHPLTIQSVAWITELKNTLSLPLLLIAVDRFLEFDATGKRRDYVAALFLFLAALLSKTSVVALPPMLLLFAWWKRGRIVRRDLLVAAPFFALSLILGLVTVWFQRHVAVGAAAAAFNPIGGPLARVLCAGSCVFFYLGKAFAPFQLSPIYPQWPIGLSSWWLWLTWPALALFVGWAWRARGGWGRHALLGVGWFVLFLLPVIGFVPISSQRYTWVMDHLAYVSLLGVIGLVAAGLSATLMRLSPAIERLAVLGFVLLAATLAGISHHHARIFENEESLWRHAVAEQPTAWFAQFNLGNALRAQGRAADALPFFEATLRLRPDFADAFYNQGNTLRALGRPDDAIAAYQRAVELQPTLALAHSNLAVLYAQTGKIEEALAACQHALNLRPDLFDAQLNAGLLSLRVNRPTEAIGYLSAAARLAPESVPTQFNLAKCLARLGRQAEAIPHFEAAERLLPNHAQILAEFARTLAAVGRVDEARVRYARARALDGNLPAPDF